MVYYGRRKTTFRKFGKYAKKKAYRKFKKTGSGIGALAKKVGRIQREVRRKKIALYTVNSASSVTTNLSSPYTIQKLCKFSDDTPIFGTDPNDLLGSKVLFKSMTCKVNVNMENLSETEEETQRVEMYVVRLRDEANDIFNVTNGDITLTSNIHYWQFGPTGVVNGGYAYLNKKYFEILHHKRFELTNYGSALGSSAAQNEYGTNWHYDFKIKVDKIINAGMSNSVDQSWKTLVCPRDPSENYYIIWFNDNSTLDGEYLRCNNLCLKKFEKLDN